jgi:hypothetical protein
MNRPDTVGCLKCAGSVVLFVIATFLLWMLTTPARADSAIRVDPDCEPASETCVIVAADLFALLRNNDRGWAIAHGLSDKVKELQDRLDKDPPKCATVEVVPKNPPPKKLPPIKPERDS